jgi:mannose-6-phosphate isomerase
MTVRDNRSTSVSLRPVEASVRVDKPWGYELIWAHTAAYAGKILHIDAGQRLSLHYHQRKEETFYLLSGRMRLELEDADGQMSCRVLAVGDIAHVPPGRRHRMLALDDTDLLEVSTGDLDDVVRLQDDFGRAR